MEGKIVIGVLAVVLFVLAMFFVNLPLTGNVISAPAQDVKNTTVFLHAGTLLASVSKGETAFYVQDHLGSSRKVIDGNVEKQETAYSPFGVTSTAKSDDNDYLYTGKERDVETGLYYYGARYYQPSVGRFVSADALMGGLGEPLALQRYAYVQNNPLKFVDPTGNKNRPNDKNLVFGVNVGIGFTRGFVGSLLKGKNVGESFTSGLTGAAGGAISYTGKALAAQNPENIGRSWGGKFIHSLGVSMQENAEEGKGAFSRYMTNMGPLYYTFGEHEKKGKNQGSIFNFALGKGFSVNYVEAGGFLLVPLGMEGSRFDAKKSLFALTPVWENDKELNERGAWGLASPGGNIFLHSKSGTSTFGHELVHQFQYREVMNSETEFSANLLYALMGKLSGDSDTGSDYYYNDPLEYEAHSLDPYEGTRGGSNEEAEEDPLTKRRGWLD